MIPVPRIPPRPARIAAFNNWAGGAPGTKGCATIGTDGRWTATRCDETHGYICQHQMF